MNKEPDRNQRKALGKGLSALLPSRPPSGPVPVPGESGAAAAAKQELPEHFEAFESIALDAIQPSDQQPRESFDEHAIEGLAQSIRAHGVIQPITVFRTSAGRYQLVAGERRWRAARIAGLKEIPAMVRASADQNRHLELALIENLQREDLGPIEVAAAFARLSSEHGLSHEQIAERTGKDRSTVTNLLRLLRLPVAVRDEVERGNISPGHARCLLNLSSADLQCAVCKQIVEKRLSVRDTEALCKKLSSDGPVAVQRKEVAPIDPNVRAALDEMSSVLGTKVKLTPKSKNAGKIEVEYYSQDDLDRIYAIIVKQQ